MKKILIVDDNHINLSVLKILVKKIDGGFCLTLVDNGAQAIEIARGEDFDLIMIDIRMPIVDGRQVIKAIRTMDRHKETKILAMTADLLLSKQEWQKIGADDFIIMPDRAKNYTEKINSLLK